MPMMMTDDDDDDADDDDDDDYANLDQDECRTVGKWLSLGGKPRRRRRVISLVSTLHSLTPILWLFENIYIFYLLRNLFSSLNTCILTSHLLCLAVHSPAT